MSKPGAPSASIVRAHDPILEALCGLRYGQLEIQLHAQWAKLMRTERLRLFEDCPAPPYDTGDG